MVNIDERIGLKLENSFTQLTGALFTKEKPTEVAAPKLLFLNERLAKKLGLNPTVLKEEAVHLLAGNELPENTQPFSQAYAGHQFGQFTMLGDGRAIMLGEQRTPSGERFDLQWKGAGPTRFSRRGDGRSVLGPVLREYLMSEAMHALGIPTTRALAATATGEKVYRETVKDGAILLRVASSHIRVGSFEYAARAKDGPFTEELLQYTIDRHYPDLNKANNKPLAFLETVIDKQAELIALWMSVGFVHGVMNTDNMLVSGETIDYGPCAFIDQFDLNSVYSSIDQQGRYMYGNQPAIAHWNLARLAETLIPLIDDDLDKAIEVATDLVNTFPTLYETYWYDKMGKKIGLPSVGAKEKEIIDRLLTILEEDKVDYHYFFSNLTLNEEDLPVFKTENYLNWRADWQALVRKSGLEAEARTLMKQHNPALVPRNHLVEKAIKQAEREGDFSDFDYLLRLLENPYAYSDEQAAYAKILPNPDERFITYCGT